MICGIKYITNHSISILSQNMLAISNNLHDLHFNQLNLSYNVPARSFILRDLSLDLLATCVSQNSQQKQRKHN